jgi:hypothetical protein
MWKICQREVRRVNRINIEVNQYHIGPLFELTQSVPCSLSRLAIEARDRKTDHLALFQGLLLPLLESQRQITKIDDLDTASLHASDETCTTQCLRGLLLPYSVRSGTGGDSDQSNLVKHRSPQFPFS